MKKVLFIAIHQKNTAPNQRYRFEQYLDFLELNGFECTLSPLILTINEKNLFYGNDYIRKIIIGIKMAFRRFHDLSRKNQYDIIFIVREAFMTRGTLFERALRTSKAKLVFDFDDSIWINVVSEKNRHFRWLKDAGKTGKIIRLCDAVIAGNKYLADYGRAFNPNVVIIPTTIDTEYYQPSYPEITEPVIIGWTGSASTIDHFKTAIPVLTSLKKKYGNKIDFRIIGDSEFKYEPLGIKGISWNAATEVEDLWPIHVGIMPLPDNDWTKGKCGLKGLQYMALEIPTVMSSVGVNTEIIQDGVNGFLASAPEEWIEKLSLLIESLPLRMRLGKAGRLTVEKKYSTKSQKESYLAIFKSLSNS